jgi:putative ABC transport system substrate-binding protein
MRRREFIIAFGGAAVLPFPALGQQAASRIVGVLGFGSLEGTRAAFAPTQRRLAELGYVEGRNLTIEYRGGNGQESQLAALAGELVQRRVDAMAVFAGQSIVAAKAGALT